MNSNCIVEISVGEAKALYNAAQAVFELHDDGSESLLESEAPTEKGTYGIEAKLHWKKTEEPKRGTYTVHCASGESMRVMGMIPVDHIEELSKLSEKVIGGRKDTLIMDLKKGAELGASWYIVQSGMQDE